MEPEEVKQSRIRFSNLRIDEEDEEEEEEDNKMIKKNRCAINH